MSWSSPEGPQDGASEQADFQRRHDTTFGFFFPPQKVETNQTEMSLALGHATFLVHHR